MARKMPSKSARCIGSSLSERRAPRVRGRLARIISRTAWMRSPSKNMCSVRHRPMPSAPNSRAFARVAGVSAFARTFSVRNGPPTP
jgi:hypothetical protein